jgi:hypothetical protein
VYGKYRTCCTFKHSLTCICQIMALKDRVVKRTQLVRTHCDVFGKVSWPYPVCLLLSPFCMYDFYVCRLLLIAYLCSFILVHISLPCTPLCSVPSRPKAPSMTPTYLTTETFTTSCSRNSVCASYCRYFHHLIY